jgi:hypothetical protein
LNYRLFARRQLLGTSRDPARDFVRRQDTACKPGFENGAGHTPNGAARFILGKDGSATRNEA